MALAHRLFVLPVAIVRADAAYGTKAVVSALSSTYGQPGGRNRPAVVACSALKKVYREQLQIGNDGLVFIYLRGDVERIGRRLAERRDHYMPAGLLESQFADLEEPGPGEALVVDIDVTAGELVARLEGRGAGARRSRG